MSNESFGRGAWERPTRPARPTQPPSKPPTMNKIYTPEKIDESGKADEFYQWLDKIFGDPAPQCLFCIANTGAHCPAIKDGKLNVDLCRSSLFQSFLLTNRSDDND